MKVIVTAKESLVTIETTARQTLLEPYDKSHPILFIRVDTIRKSGRFVSTCEYKIVTHSELWMHYPSEASIKSHRIVGETLEIKIEVD